MTGGWSIEPLTDKDGDPTVDRRLEILREVETIFPGLPTPQVLDLARWVEGNVTPAHTAAREFRKAGVSGPRKWTNLDAIPSTVKAITDKVGDRAEPQTLQGQRAWVFTDEPFGGLGASPDDGPFTEVLENE